MRQAMFLVLLLPLGCVPGGARPVTGPVDLDPGPPLVAVTVADAQEAALLIDAMGASPVLGAGGRLYFPAALAERVRAAGFDVQTADPAQVLRRVARAYADDAPLRAAGVRLLRRGPGYWVVEGTIQELRGLTQAGVRLAQPGRNEPIPLEVHVTLPTAADVQRVNEMDVDIFNATPSGGRYVVTGSAYEWQIEAMTAAGYVVERVSTVPPTTE